MAKHTLQHTLVQQAIIGVSSIALLASIGVNYYAQQRASAQASQQFVVQGFMQLLDVFVNVLHRACAGLGIRNRRRNTISHNNYPHY